MEAGSRMAFRGMKGGQTVSGSSARPRRDRRGGRGGPVRRPSGRLGRRRSAGGRGPFSRRARAGPTQGALAVPRGAGAGRGAVQGAGSRPPPTFLVRLDDRPRLSKCWTMSRVSCLLGWGLGAEGWARIVDDEGSLF